MFLKHPELELSTNLAENSMRPIAIGQEELAASGQQGSGTEDRRHLLGRRELSPAQHPNPQISCRCASRPRQPLHPVPCRTNPSCLRRQTGELRSLLGPPNVNRVVARTDTNNFIVLGTRDLLGEKQFWARRKRFALVESAAGLSCLPGFLIPGSCNPGGRS